MSRTVFENLAWLFAPADDPGGCALVEAPADWQVRLPAGVSAVAWGRLPARGRSPVGAVRSALLRERSLGVLRSGRHGLRFWDAHRLPPIGSRPQWQVPIRDALMGGLIVRLGTLEPRPRVADEVARRAGASESGIDLRISGDGSARAQVSLAGDRRVLLRLARVGGFKEAARNTAALRQLGDAGMAHVPRLHRAGTALDVDWSIEDLLTGSPARVLSTELLADAAGWAATLPRSGGPALGVVERLEAVSQAFPRSAVDLSKALRRVRERAGDVPGVLEHGDFWTGNLLVEGPRLAGVVDWDNWHPAGVPGSDLLHLIAMASRTRKGMELGEVWLQRPWATDAFRAATAAYWPRFGVALDDDLAWLIAVGWWASHVTAGLRRGRQPARDPRWVARNVENVAQMLAAAR